MPRISRQLATALDAVAAGRAERQQHDWTTWLQDTAGQWRCPACGDVEPTADTLHDRHGWQPDLSKTGHPYPISWPGRYEEGGYVGHGGRCDALRLAWLVEHYGEWPPPPVPYGTTFGN